jgi:hypothetical protein
MELSEISRVGRRRAAHLFGEHFGQVEKNVCKRMVVELRTKIGDLDKAEGLLLYPAGRTISNAEISDPG